MNIEILASKIHRAVVTDANLNYVGSISIGEELIKAANLIENQKVEILDVNFAFFALYHVCGKSLAVIYV